MDIDEGMNINPEQDIQIGDRTNDLQSIYRILHESACIIEFIK